MSPANTPAPISKGALWTSYVMSALPSVLLLFSASMKFAKPPAANEGIEHLGIPLSQLTGLGILETACVVIYLIPRTSVLGAILVTGYLGGATAITLRVGEPWFMTPLVGVLVWGGLFLREPRLRALIPFRT